MKRIIIVLAVLALLLYGGLPAGALPITYVEETIGTGILGSNSFTDSLVKVTLVGDTTNVTPHPAGFSNLGAATVYVANLGTTATFTDTMWAFVNQRNLAAGISDVTKNRLVLGTDNSVFASYGLATAIGPISGPSAYNPPDTFPTALGNFGLTNVGNSTFTATVSTVPTVQIIGVFVYTDNRGPNGFAPEGYYFVIGSPAITPSGLGTTVQATHIPPGSGPDYPLQHSPSPFYPNLYASFVPYSGQTGQWRISATRGLDVASMNTYILDDPKLLPLASNLTVSGPLLTPTLSWNLFDQTLYSSSLTLPIAIGSDFYMQRVRIRLAEDGMPIIFDSSTFNTNIDSFTIPDGKLVENEDYLFDLMLLHFDLNSISPQITQMENISETFKFYSTTLVPEPTTMLLLGSGLIGLAGYGRKKFFKK